MMCPHCGAVSRVLGRKSASDWLISISRQCGYGHNFTTMEVHSNMVADHRELSAALRALRTRVSKWERNREIATDPRSARAVAAAHKMTPARVRQIRANFLRLNPVETAREFSSSTQKGSLS